MAILGPSDEDVAKLREDERIDVLSDADTYARALKDIEFWCAARGLVRDPQELRRGSVSDGPAAVWSGQCFRPSERWCQNRHQLFEDVKLWVTTSPMTVSSVDLLRED